MKWLRKREKDQKPVTNAEWWEWFRAVERVKIEAARVLMPPPPPPN